MQTVKQLASKLSTAMKISSNVKVKLANVPYGAGTSKDGKTVYIDKRIPKTMYVLGKTANVHMALIHHETAEKQAMDDGMPYKEAHHTVGVKAEENYLKLHGINPQEYNDKLGAIMKKIENTPSGNTPKDIETKPYKQTGAMHLLKP